MVIFFQKYAIAVDIRAKKGYINAGVIS